ncbi:MAG: hypothetical protein MI741_11255 [Rhodospirillales bacterium]|nr:hypothetical protein [Rhodospirillales bacterium]
MTTRISHEQLEALRIDRALGALNEDVEALLDAYLAERGDQRAAGTNDPMFEIEQIVTLARQAAWTGSSRDATEESPSASLPIECWQMQEERRVARVAIRRRLSLAAVLVMGIGLGWVFAPRPDSASMPISDRSSAGGDEKTLVGQDPLATAIADSSRRSTTLSHDRTARFWSVARLSDASAESDNAPTTPRTSRASFAGMPSRHGLPWSSTATQ